MPVRSAFLVATGLLVVSLGILLPGSGHAWPFENGIKGSGDLDTREVDLPDFDRVTLDGAFDIFITIGNRQRVEVTLDDNLFDRLQAKVRRSTLELDLEGKCRPSRSCRVDITVPTLTAVTLNGAGDIEVSDLDGGEFSLALNGAGDLTLAGKADVLDIKLSGAGDVDARDLVADEVDVRLNGVGDAVVHAERKFRGVVSGVGSITYYGDPDQESTRVTGIGKIRKK